MMNLKGIHKGSATTVVWIDNAPEGADDETLAGFAMQVANETPSSLFGWQVFPRTDDGSIRIDLWTA